MPVVEGGDDVWGCFGALASEGTRSHDGLHPAGVDLPSLAELHAERLVVHVAGFCATLGIGQQMFIVAVGEMNVVAAGEGLVAFVVDVNMCRTEQAVGNVGIGLVFNPTDETTPAIGMCALKPAIEEAVVDVGVIRVFTGAEFADKAAVGAVAIVAMDFDARVTVADVAGAVSNADEAACKQFMVLGDFSRHMQVLDGGVPDIAERGASVFVAVVLIVDRQSVSASVEGASEVHVLATSHHLRWGSIECFLHRDVGHQFEELAAVVAGILVHVSAQRNPVVHGVDLVWGGFCAAASSLCPCRLHVGKEGEEQCP